MKPLYEGVTFQPPSNRPFFYSNFVTTIDGKVQVLNPDSHKYWPIGSKIDLATLYELRAHGDVLIHGKNTALVHGNKTFESIVKESFLSRRKELKKKQLLYLIISDQPQKELIELIRHNYKSCNVKLVCSNNAKDLESLPEEAILRLNSQSIDLQLLAKELHISGYRSVLVEGGPKLLGSFLNERLLDEMFVTIAPKIFGNAGNTITMVEDVLFKPSEVKECKLIEYHAIGNEMFLRYKVAHK